MTLGKFLQDANQFNFFVVSISRNKFFIFVLLWQAKFLRAPIKDATRWWGSELQREIGSSARFEEMDTEIGTCFPIQVVVFVSLKVSSWTPIDSKSSIAKFLKSFCSLVYLILKESILSKRVSRIWYRFQGYTFFTRSLHVVICRSKLNVLLKKVSQIGQRKDWKTALILFT